MNFPLLADEFRIERLTPPSKSPVRMILDTDAFNEIDDQTAKAVCVIGAHIRNRLFGDSESTGREVNPVGKIIHINRQPFTVIGMFTEYMTDAERKRRELESQKRKEQTGPKRQTGYGYRRDGFYHKNNVVYIPINTMWMRFKVSSGIDDTPEPNLTDIDIKVADLKYMEKAIKADFLH